MYFNVLCHTEYLSVFKFDKIMQRINIPKMFIDKIESNDLYYSIVLKVKSYFEEILSDNNLFFFSEYTNHGTNHINSVLEFSKRIISESTFNLLSAEDICVLILSIFTHDFGMQCEYATFKAMLDGAYDDIKIESRWFKGGDLTWYELWLSYLSEIKKYNNNQSKLIFGTSYINSNEIELNNIDLLNGTQKKIIGEFIRRHHPRIAHEISLKGIIGNDNSVVPIAEDLPYHNRKIVGIIARSHGMELRDTFSYLKNIVFSEKNWSKPYNIHATFLMVVLRISDYFQVTKDRIPIITLKLKTFNSTLSLHEHIKHLDVEYIDEDKDDPETLFIFAKPRNAIIYTSLITLFKDIQHELDTSWAVLGEVYGNSKGQPAIKYRRVISNIEEQSFLSQISYVPEKIFFQADIELPKLLISPLYGDNPTFAIRELIQNSVDACRERKYKDLRFTPRILVEVNFNSKQPFVLIEDNGRGMTLNEIKNYFLKAGASYRRSYEWKNDYLNTEGHSLIQRTGRFGVGILASFLLGDEIEVTTKNSSEEFGYSFKANIDSEQIEIKSFKTHNTGTVIKINSSVTILNFLISSKNSPYSRSWEKWYTSDNPLVLYKIKKNNETEILSKRNEPNFEESDLNWHSIFPKSFSKVNWSFDAIDKSYNISCNNIVVPRRYELDNVYIKSCPNISIFDFDGNLPLSLNRSDLLSKLPFENELIADIYRDFIARILMYKPLIKIKENDIDISLDYIGHRSFEKKMKQFKILHHKRGFVLNYSYFTRKLEFKNILNVYPVSTNYDLTKIKFNINNFDQVLHFDSISFAEINNNNLNNFTRTASKLILTKNVLSVCGRSIINSYTFDSPLHFKKEHKHILGFFHSIEPKVNIIEFENIKDFIAVETDFFELGSCPILDQELSNYFGDNIFIPYNFEERRSLFKDVYKDLKLFLDDKK